MVIPEDFRKDQYTLRPIVKAMFRHLGRANVLVSICTDPNIGGVDDALKWDRIHEILDMYGAYYHAYLLCVDRDCEEGRCVQLAKLEERALSDADRKYYLFAENAWQELEAWILAGMTDLPKAWDWKQVRSERELKETYYDAYVEQRMLDHHPDGGRGELAIEAARQYRNRVRRLCPEDIMALENRVKIWLEAAEGHSTSAD